MLIECSEFNIKLFILLIYPVFKRIGDFSREWYIIKDNELFKTFRFFICHTFSSIFLIIIYYRTKSSKRINFEIESDKNIDYNTNLSSLISELETENIKKKKIRSLLFIIVLCGLSAFCYFYKQLFQKGDYSKAKQSLGILFDIILYTSLSYFILKQKLYKHNYVSAGIISAMLLILFFISISYIDNELIFPSFLYYLFNSLSYGLYDVLFKKYMIIFYNTPYFTMSAIGAINAALVLIYDIFAYNLNTDASGVIIGFQLNITSAGNLFKFLIDLLVEFIWNIGIFLTIYYQTPCHYFISRYISEYIYYIIKATSSKEDYYSTVNIIIFSITYFINFFFCLVFNEVIILNIFGLDYNTTKRIKERIGVESIQNANDKNLLPDEENAEEEKDSKIEMKNYSFEM